jgi:hypothetical protein
VSIPESMAVMKITLGDRGAALFRPTAKMPTDTWSVDEEVANGRTLDRVAGD